MNQYNALLLATDRIDHTIQALDEKLMILHEFHQTTRDLPCTLATQLNLKAGNEEVLQDEDEMERREGGSQSSEDEDETVKEYSTTKKGKEDPEEQENPEEKQKQENFSGKDCFW